MSSANLKSRIAESCLHVSSYPAFQIHRAKPGSKEKRSFFELVHSGITGTFSELVHSGTPRSFFELLPPYSR